MQRFLNQSTFLLITPLLISIFSGCVARQNKEISYNKYSNYQPNNYKTCREKRYNFKPRNNKQIEYRYNYKYDEALIQEEIDNSKNRLLAKKHKKISENPWKKRKEEKTHPYYYNEGEFPSNVPRNSIQ